MTSRADAVGLVLARPARMLGLEPFFMELIGGIEESLAVDGRSILLHVVPDLEAEIRAYRRWGHGHMVDAVVLVNLVADDPRLPLLTELALPTVVVGGPQPELPFSSVGIDNAQAMRDAVSHLVSLGHTNLARVSGPRTLVHTQVRTATFLAECARHDVPATVVEGDYSEASGMRATHALLDRPDAPSAIIYDNDVMAVAGLGVAVDRRIEVPTGLSLLAWDDSALCRLSHPPLSAMSLDVHAMGVQVAGCVLNLLAGGPVVSHMAPLPRLVTRGSTAPPTL